MSAEDLLRALERQGWVVVGRSARLDGVAVEVVDTLALVDNGVEVSLRSYGRMMRVIISGRGALEVVTVLAEWLRSGRVFGL